MFSLVINDTPILADEDENDNFTFDVALLEAAKVDRVEAVQFILELRANVDAALLKAAKVGHCKAAQFLVKLGANSDIALHKVAKGDDKGAAQFLLKLGASADIALFESAKFCHCNAAQFLVKLGANSDLALHEAAKVNDNEAAQFLLKLGASTDIALFESAKFGHCKAAQFLLKLGASADIALFESAKFCHCNAAQFLVKLGANSDLALHEAAKVNDNKAAQFLLKLGASTDIALFESAKIGHCKATAQFLLNFGANANVALHEVAKGDDNEAAQFLLNLGASADIALFESAKVSHDKAAQFLLNLGANTNVAIYEAARIDDNEAVQFLLNLGASTDADQIKKIMADVLQEQHYPLQVASKHCLLQMAPDMFSYGMITEPVKDQQTYNKLISDFKAGMKFKGVPALQKYWQSFLEILSNQRGGGVQDAADYLHTELKDRLRSLNPTAIQSTYTLSSRFNHEGVKIVELDNEDDIKKQLHDLHQKFAGLMRQIITKLNEEIQNQTTKTSLSDIAGYVQDYISWESLDVSHIHDLNGLFKQLHHFYDFLDCDINVPIAVEYINNSDLIKKLQNHSKEAIEF